MRNYKTLLASWLFVVLCVLSNTALAAPEAGWWWNPNESGRGFFIESQNGVTFLGGYFYTDDGRATWLVAGGQNADSYNYAGPLYAVRDGQTLFGDYVAPSPGVDVGPVSLHFSDDTHATLTWPGGTIPLQREYFDNTTAVFQPFTGWWWNPDESGRGFSLELQGNRLFIVGFMYDDAGNPVWYLSAGTLSSPTTYSGDLLQISGGQTMTGPYQPPTGTTKVGTLDVEFTTVDEATLTFTDTVTAKKGAKRKRNVPVRPEFKHYPLGWNGSFSYTTSLHSDIGGTSDGQLTLSSSDLVWSEGQFPIPGFYQPASGDLATTFHQVNTTDAGTCVGTGSAHGPIQSLHITWLLLADSREYSLTMNLDLGDYYMTINWVCTDSDGRIDTFSTDYSPVTTIGTYEGVVDPSGITIHAGFVNSETSPGVFSTVSAQWNFTAFWK